jgi:hypothetical protein
MEISYGKTLDYTPQKIQSNPIIGQLNSLACNKNLEISCIILRKRRLYIKIIIEIILNVEMDASHPASCRVQRKEEVEGSTPVTGETIANKLQI